MTCINRSRIAAALCAAALTAAPTYAQSAQSGTDYCKTASHTLSTDITSNDVFVGKTTAFATLTGTITLTVATGATITVWGTTQSGSTYTGLIVFGSHRANIQGGDVASALGIDTGTVNISGGSVFNSYATSGSVTNISGGSVANAMGYGTGTVNIRGGVTARAGGYDASVTNISGGVLTNGIGLFDLTATVNFIGTNLSFAYTGYGIAAAHGNIDADKFKVSGTIGGAAKTYDLYIRNTSRVPNSTPRGVNFNGAPATAVVPEAGTLALLLPALGVVCGAVLIRRGK